MDRKYIGSLLRRERESRGLKMGSVATKGLSIPTISRIENGGEHVSPEKIHLYAQQLGTTIPDLIEKDRQFADTLQQKFLMLDLRIDLGANLDMCLKDLDGFNVDENHLYYPVWLYYRGKILYVMEKTWEAEPYLQKAIRQIERKTDEEFEILRKKNVLALAHNILSNIYYKHRDLKRAITESELALDLFDLDGEQKDKYFMILMNRVSYLEKQEKILEAASLIDYLFENRNSISRITVRLNVYDQKARLLLEKGDYTKAIDVCFEGLKLACDEKQTDRACELWTTLGRVYEKMGMYANALENYNLALQTRNQLKNQSLIISTYTYLGSLHMKMKNWDTAEEAFIQALSHDDRGPRYVDALIGMYNLRFTQGKIHDAITYLEKAYELAKKLGIANKVRDIVGALCLHTERVNPEKYTKYIKELQHINIQIIQGRGFLHV